MAVMASPVGERIRLRRQALGMSQKELGERVGASESSVLAWEKGRWFPARKQGAVEAALGISLSDGEGAKAPDPNEEALRNLDLDPRRMEKLVEAYRRIMQNGTNPHKRAG